MSNKHNFKTTPGGSFSRRISLENDDLTAVNLTGYVVRFLITSNKDSVTPPTVDSQGNGITVTPVEGHMDVAFVAPAEGGLYPYQLTIQLGAATPEKIIEGFLVVTA